MGVLQSTKRAKKVQWRAEKQGSGEHSGKSRARAEGNTSLRSDSADQTLQCLMSKHHVVVVSGKVWGLKNGRGVLVSCRQG